MTRSRGLEIDFFNERVRLDAAGARRRRQNAIEAERVANDLRDSNHKRVQTAAGKIPVLKSLDSILEYATEVNRDFMSRDSKLSFPVLQIGKKLDTNEVFSTLPQNFGREPNVLAVSTGQTSLGPHFDGYSDNFSPWTIHENISGRGAIQATFITEGLFSAYKLLKDSLPRTDLSDELLANHRAQLGAIVLAQPRAIVYSGELAPGTRTLIWHGDRHTPPAVHDFVREGPGDFRIYAHQLSGDLGEGFVSLK